MDMSSMRNRHYGAKKADQVQAPAIGEDRPHRKEAVRNEIEETER